MLASCRNCCERGSILVTFMFASLAVFILAGLAVDSGNLYTAKLNAQAAADAASLAGLGLLNSRGNRTDGNIIAATRSLARANLNANGVADERVNWAGPGVNAGGVRADILAQGNFTVMQVRIDVDVPLYLIGGLPGMGGNIRSVSAQGRAASRPANVSIIIDTSDSMRCPQSGDASGTACSCVPNCDQSAADAKIQQLIGAADEFVRQFDTSRDSLNLVAFGHGAELLVPFAPGGQRGFNLTDMTDAIGDLTAQGGTNLADGLITAYLDARSAQKHVETNYVIFSDGAPTAGRFLFTRESVNSKWQNDRRFQNEVINNDAFSFPDWAKYDYINWGIAVRHTPAGGNELPSPIPSVMYRTPPPEDFTGSSASGLGGYDYWNKRTFHAVDVPDPPGWPIGRGSPGQSLRNIDDPAYAFRGPDNNNMLLRKLEVWMPDGESRVNLGRDHLWQNNNTVDWSRWDRTQDHLRIYTDLAILLADFLRGENASLFVIGYGPGAGVAVGAADGAQLDCTVAGNCTDPYQDATQSLIRKDITNRRLALTTCGLDDPPFTIFNSSILPPNEAVLQFQQNLGEYYPVSSAENLASAFSKIAQRIKIRMVTNSN